MHGKMIAMQDIIYCEFCELPHKPGVRLCERCHHEMGTIPDVAALEAEIPGHKRKLMLGSGALVLIILANWFILGPVGAVVLLAPIAWVWDSIARLRLFKQWLPVARSKWPKT